MRHTLFVAALAAVSGPSVALETLEPIVVSATRAPDPSIGTAANIQVIDRDQIADSGANNLPELLRGRAGVHIRDLFGDGSNAGIDMRGFGSSAGSNVLVLLDGRRLNPATDTSVLYLNDISLSEVERVEIVQGSSGVLFGNQAVGGVINIITRRPESGDARLTLSGGSFSRRSVDGTFNHVMDNGVGFSLDARHLETDNYREHNKLRVQNLGLLLDRETEAGRVFLEQRHLDEWTQTPGALFLDELATDRRRSAIAYADDFIHTRSDVTRFGVEQELDARWRFDGEASYRDDRRRFLQNSRTLANPLSTQIRRILTLNPRLLGRFSRTHSDTRPTPHLTTRLTLGIDWEQTDYEIDALILQRAEQEILAGYAQLVYPLAERWELALGGRHARVENDIKHDTGGFAETRLDLNDSVTVGSVGLTYRPRPAWRLFARADQNYRFAKLSEHTQDLAAGSPPFLPRGLANQTGTSYEAGAAYEAAQTRITAQIYRLVLDNEITFDAANFANINLDETERTGLTLSAWRAITPDLEFGLDLDLMEGEVSSGPQDGKRIPLVPNHQLRLSGRWAVSTRLQFGADWLYVGEQTLDSDYDNRFRKLPSYRVLNLNGSYRHGAWRIRAAINNLFDRDYSEYGVVGADTLGSGHPGCVSGAFSDNCPAENPAPERNASLTLEYRFR